MISGQGQLNARHVSLGFFFSQVSRHFSFIFRLETAIPLLLREIMTLSRDNAISIAFPDEGAFKRFHTMFTSFPTITCTKIRDGDKRIVRVKDGNHDQPVLFNYIYI